MNRIAILLVASALGGCALPMLGAAGAGAGLGAVGTVVATADTADQDAKTALAVVKPLNAAACDLVLEDKTLDVPLRAAFTAFCAELPDDPLQVPKQFIDTALAYRKAKSAEMEHDK